MKKINQTTSGKLKVKEYFIRGIYFLYYKNKIVYVGKSHTNIMSRISLHFLDIEKTFDSFEIKNCINLNDSQLSEMEIYYIKEYKPKYNYVHNMTYQNKKIDKRISCVHEWDKIERWTKNIRCIKCGKEEPIMFLKDGIFKYY